MQVIDKKKVTTKNIDIVSVAAQIFSSKSNQKLETKGKSSVDTGGPKGGTFKSKRAPVGYKGPKSPIGSGVFGVVPPGGH